MPSPEQPLGTIGDAFRAKQEEAARREAERARRRDDAPEAPPPSEPPEKPVQELEVLELSKFGRPRKAPETADTSRAAPEAPEPEWSPEERQRLEQIADALDTLRVEKQKKGALSVEGLDTLKVLLLALQIITRGEFGLGPGEYHARFEESHDPRRGRSFISRDPSRKMIILDRAAAQVPVSGKRYKVRVMRDTAPGERHGVLFVDFVPEAGGTA